jgi:hypothetical protein
VIALYITLVFAVDVAVAYLGAHVARRKGLPFGLYFAAGLVIGPDRPVRRTAAAEASTAGLIAAHTRDERAGLPQWAS